MFDMKYHGTFSNSEKCLMRLMKETIKTTKLVHILCSTLREKINIHKRV